MIIRSFFICLLVITVSAFLSSCLVSSTTTSQAKSTTEVNSNNNNNGRQTIVRKAPALLEEVQADTLKFEPDPYSSLVEMETKFGVMKIELFFDAEKHRENFLKLAKAAYYDSLMFHRVIKNFMAQGGDSKSRYAKKNQRLGSGIAGYQLDNEIGQHFYHVKGALAAARQPDELNPDKKSSSSQFYIVQGASVNTEQLDKNERKYDIVYTEKQRELYNKLGGSPQLDMEYTVFGRVYEGIELIDSICYKPTDAYARPLEDLRFKVRVIRD